MLLVLYHLLKSLLLDFHVLNIILLHHFFSSLFVPLLACDDNNNNNNNNNIRLGGFACLRERERERETERPVETRPTRSESHCCKEHEERPVETRPYVMSRTRTFPKIRPYTHAQCVETRIVGEQERPNLSCVAEG